MFRLVQVEWCPFDDSRLAISTAQNFGIIGTGKQHVASIKGSNVKEVASYETKDGVFDCTWSEAVDGHLAFATGDGAVRIWDTNKNKILRQYSEHTAEVYAVDWNLVTKVGLHSHAPPY